MLFGRHQELEAFHSLLILLLLEECGELRFVQLCGGRYEQVGGDGETDVGVECVGLKAEKTRREENEGERDGLQQCQTGVAASMETLVVLDVERAVANRGAAREEKQEERSEPPRGEGGH